LVRNTEIENFNKIFGESNFTNSIYYGEKYFSIYNEKKISYIQKKIDYIKSINSTKNELIRIFDQNSIDKVMIFDSYDIAVEVICNFKKSIPVYYIQHSAIVSSLNQITFRQRYDNFLCRLFCGFDNIRTTNNPPFNHKNINYLLWTRLWSNNVDAKEYKIKYLSKILMDEKKYRNTSKNNINKILVILNKKRNIGNFNWNVFADFYLSFFNRFTKYNVVFKVHPSEDLNFCKDYFDSYEVIKDDINILDYDLVFSHWSTFIFEVAMSGVPFILINPKNKFDYKIWRLNHYPLIISSIVELKKKIDDIDNKSINIKNILDDFIETSLGKNLTTSVDKLSDIIKKH